MQPTTKPINGAPTKDGALPLAESIVDEAIAWLTIGGVDTGVGRVMMSSSLVVQV